MKMFCVRGGAFQASRALRAEHENAGLRQIAFGDWERGVVAGFEASLHPSPPPRSHPPGYAEVPRHENRTKNHERTACRERTISFTPADASRSPVLGCEKYFVSFRETFVFRAKRREAPHPLHRAPPSAAGADARPRKSLPRHRAVRDLRPATAAGFQA